MLWLKRSPHAIAELKLLIDNRQEMSSLPDLAGESERSHGLSPQGLVDKGGAPGGDLC